MVRDGDCDESERERVQQRSQWAVHAPRSVAWQSWVCLGILDSVASGRKAAQFRATSDESRKGGAPVNGVNAL